MSGNHTFLSSINHLHYVTHYSAPVKLGTLEIISKIYNLHQISPFSLKEVIEAKEKDKLCNTQ